MVSRTRLRLFSLHLPFSLSLGLGTLATSALLLAPASAQVTNAAGTIQGTITDPSGAVLPGVLVTISQPSTGATKTLTTNGSGYYSAGTLVPGTYRVHATLTGFSSIDETLEVQVGNAANGSLKLGVGSSATTVQVEANALSVDTTQTTIQGVLTQQQIQALPLNGRNFLDLAQLQPGVQIQDGTSFDPTKNGFSSISFGGRYGRTARIELDGLDISDENVGTTTQNISEDAIQEFQVAQSNLDISTSITSSGSVNVVSRSGSNAVHGEEGYNFRDKRAGGANFPGGQNNYLQRNNVSGGVGAALIPDKVFYFFSAENFTQHLNAPVNLAGTALSDVSATNPYFGSPYHELELLGRFDFNLPNGYKAFIRGAYHHNTDVAGFGGSNNYSPYNNEDNTPNVGGGLDFLTGNFSHSFRVGYFKFVNHITDATSGGGIYNPLLANGITTSVAIGSFSSGPSYLAPQTTVQSNRQSKYDGSWTKGPHTIRYGAGYTRLYGGGFASFYGIGPYIESSYDTATLAYMQSSNYTMPFAGGTGNPLNYPVGYSNGNQSTGAVLGNGQGYDTEIANFGFPGGGQFDTRVTAYLGDTWKVMPKLVVNYGLRYIHDTGRNDADLPTIPLLDQLGPGLGNRVHQPGSNFGPQAGISYDITGKGTTVLRAGAGLYYENNVWNNVLFDRPARLQSGLFFGASAICPNGSINIPGLGSVSSIDGLDIATQVCGQPVGKVAGAIADLQKLYQSNTIAAGPSANGTYIGNTMSESSTYTGDVLFDPKYKTPISYQMNIGVQQALGHTAVITADYVRNTNVHTLLGIDKNHVGAARYFNQANAAAAINAAVSACNAGSLNAAIQACPGLNTTTSGVTGLTIQQLAGYGLDSEFTSGEGFPGANAVPGGATGPGFAFNGANPTFGTVQFLSPAGRSNYDALQVNLQERASHPLPGIKTSNLTVSYALSRFISTANDQDFGTTATDYDNPARFIGPNGLDRTHQFSVGWDFVITHGIELSTIAHLSSSLPSTLTLPINGAGDIFTDDYTGDGTTGDVLPGTNVGAFMRKFGAGGINKVIGNYNTNYAGKLTPAGQAVVASGLITQAQMVGLGGTLEAITPAPAGQVGNDWSRVFDLSAGYPFKIGEGLTVSPSVHAFNVLNAANFDAAGNRMASTTSSQQLSGAPGSANGTTAAEREQFRVGLGTGVYSFGAPRQIEYGLKFTF